MSKPTVALIGRTNVGKSTLFNKLVGERLSIVSDSPSVTRDRISAECFWCDRTFTVVDTGGLEKKVEVDSILEKSMNQTYIAIDTCSVVLFVVDVSVGFTLEDQKIANFLKKKNKPVIVCINKCDHVGEIDANFYEFYKLGFENMIAISSIHGHGTGDLLDKILFFLDNDKKTEEEVFINVAVIGKPNAGKSSLLNKIINEERSIVSDISGTTRDAIDVVFENEQGKFCLIDTAGLRKKSKTRDTTIEKYSVLRAKLAIERSDVCVIVVDSLEGLTDQDSKIAGLAKDAGKGCILAVNKCDIKKDPENFIKNFEKNFAKRLPFLSWAQIIFVSAKTGKNVNNLFFLIKSAYRANFSRVSTGKLNSFLMEATSRVQPPTDKGQRLKIFYMTQASTKPPTFVFFVNYKKLFHFSYQRYIENRLRESFFLISTPIRFIIRERRKVDGGRYFGPRSKRNIKFFEQ